MPFFYASLLNKVNLRKLYADHTNSLHYKWGEDAVVGKN